jgi:3',5'-cyclic AMP phosphodiesterase CpdA
MSKRDCSWKITSEVRVSDSNSDGLGAIAPLVRIESPSYRGTVWVASARVTCCDSTEVRPARLATPKT